MHRSVIYRHDGLYVRVRVPALLVQDERLGRQQLPEEVRRLRVHAVDLLRVGAAEVVAGANARALEFPVL
jgi:hypothetical protein